MSQQTFKLNGILDGWKIVSWEGRAATLAAAKQRFRKSAKKGSKVTSILLESVT